MEATPRTVVLTVSDRSFLGLRGDLAGPAILERVRARGWIVLGNQILPDEPEQISSFLRRWADQEDADLILTTGGTGLSPRDCTPEATLSVADRIVPGIAEWLRGASVLENPHACLSRGVAVLRGRCLIVNLPGSPRAVAECMDLLLRILPHALQQVSHRPAWGDTGPHPRG